MVAAEIAEATMPTVQRVAALEAEIQCDACTPDTD